MLGKLMKGGGGEQPPPGFEDYEGHVADIRAGESLAGAEAIETAREDLEA